MPTLSRPAPCRVDDSYDEARLCARVEAEFREMPGLRLTLAQAAGLFSLDVTRCERVLAALIEQGRLTTDGRTFRRPSGRPPFGRPQ